MTNSRSLNDAAAAVYDAFTMKHITLAVAESCTGGLISKTITDLPGASEFFLGGVVSYSNALKQELLKVRRGTLEKCGAVSRECAQEMAKGVRELAGSDVGISATGIAGPSGGTPDKPVGLVFIAFSSEDRSDSRELHLAVGRLEIREKTTLGALALAVEASCR